MGIVLRQKSSRFISQIDSSKVTWNIFMRHDVPSLHGTLWHIEQLITSSEHNYNRAIGNNTQFAIYHRKKTNATMAMVEVTHPLQWSVQKAIGAALAAIHAALDPQLHTTCSSQTRQDGAPSTSLFSHLLSGSSKNIIFSNPIPLAPILMLIIRSDKASTYPFILLSLLPTHRLLKKTYRSYSEPWTLILLPSALTLILQSLHVLPLLNHALSP